ncbi:MAG: DNA-directed RNA polymerase subunit omega [Bacillota bacterium]|jgi:DNA-directed RNA polymerase subunit omega|nr:DNA-directed RNA polymerase subunit omega [Bacillota bacterium]MDD3298868.1 DNA-directed RNA polymerase subunit omega [Bacillota bacterium]MDD3850969.1 DNA-directed RNA polymerase subunit omega [Bacillota bacterium]MDD4707296.1 DNA-directed RNA polymerase subunit omega [Bacillota bacterium]
MLYPSISSLLKKADSRYTLVVLAAKRARQLNRQNQISEEHNATKSVSVAIKEIEEGKIGYVRTKDGIK